MKATTKATPLLLGLVLLALIAISESTLAAKVTILNTFAGDSAIGPKAVPDNVGGVGPDHVLDFTCANVVVHDKKTGKVLQAKSQVQFWRDLGFPDLHPNDPRCLFDPLSGRWFATIADDRVHYLYLAVSSSSDPTQPWKGVQTPFDSPDFGFRMGVDKNGLYGCFWNHNKDTHAMMDCCAIPMADLIAVGGPSLANVQIFPGLEIEAFPATDLDPDKAADAPQFLLNREFGNSFNKLYLYRITWSGKTASISKLQTIPLSRTYFSPNGNSQKNLAEQPAPGGKLRADEGRRTQCVYAHGGRLFTCNAAKRELDSNPGIFWCEVRVSDAAVVQEGLVDSPDCGYLAPSLAVDSKGNIGLGCSRASAVEFASAYVMGRAASDPAGSMSAPMLAVKGTNVFTPVAPSNRGTPWGNYSASCIDPSDPTIIWTYQEYAASSVPGQFCTCWIAFRLDNGSGS